MKKYYWRFAGYALSFQVLVTVIAVLFDITSNVGSLMAAIMPAFVVVHNFIKDNDRAPDQDEVIALTNASFLITWIISILYFIIGGLIITFYFTGLEGVLFVITSPQMALNSIFDGNIPSGFWKILLVVCLIFSVIMYFIFRYMYGGYANKVYKKLQKK